MRIKQRRKKTCDCSVRCCLDGYVDKVDNDDNDDNDHNDDSDDNGDNGDNDDNDNNDDNNGVIIIQIKIESLTDVYSYNTDF